MIRVTARIALDENEIEESFVHASGPGGQNVNKVSSAVQLRFDVAHASGLPVDVRERLARLAGRRMAGHAGAGGDPGAGTAVDQPG